MYLNKGIVFLGVGIGSCLFLQLCADYQVTKSADDLTAGTLRSDILLANGAPQNIISDGGTYTITLGSILPAITDTYSIDSAVSSKLTISTTGSFATFDVAPGKTTTANLKVTSTGNITKTNTGTLVLTNNSNNYTGNTFISGGTLSISNVTQVNGKAITMSDNTTLKLTGAGTYFFNGGLNFAGNNLTIETTANVIIPGNVLGTPGHDTFTKTGAAALTIDNTPDDYQHVIVSQGTFNVSAGGIPSLVDITLTNGTTFGFVESTVSFAHPVLLTGSASIDGSSTGTISGVISESVGPYSLTKSGANSITLSNTNTYSGITTISAGILNVSADGNTGSNPSIVLNGGVLQFTASGPYTKNITLTGNSGISVTADVVLTTTIGESGGPWSLTKFGSSILTLASPNTYSGITTISAGTLKITDLNALLNTSSVSNLSTLEFSGITGDFTKTITGVGGVVNKTGAGILTLSNTNTYSGLTTITTGTLALSGSGSLANSVVNVAAASSIFDIGGVTAGTTIGNLAGVVGSSVTLGLNKTLTVGNGSDATFAGVISDVSGGSLTKQGAGALTLSGINTYSGTTTITTGTLNVALDSGTGSSTLSLNGGTLGLTGATTYTKNITLTSGSSFINTTADAILSGTIGDSGSSYSLTKVGANKLTLSGINTYSGTTTITTGTLALLNSGSIASSAVSLGASTAFDISGVTTGATIANLSSAAASSSVTLGTNKTLTVGNASSTTFAGVISDVSGGALTKQGSGKLTLSGVNTYSGTTTITTGTLALSTSGSIASSPVTLSASTVFDISGVTSGATIANLSSAAASSSVTLGTKTLTVNNASDAIFAGVISSSGGGLTKQGSGKLTLSGVNAYAGTTTITTGTLALSGSGSIASSAVSLGASTTFDISGVTTGATIASLSSAAASSSVTLGINKILTVGNSGNTTFAGVISDISGGALTKQGSGSLTLSGVNTYSGATTINAGTLSVPSDSATGSNTAITLNGGTLTLTGTAAYTKNIVLTNNSTITTAVNTEIAGQITGPFNLIKAGATRLLLSNTNTYSGTTSINAGGALVITTTQNLNNTSLVSLTTAASLSFAGAMTFFTSIRLPNGGSATLETLADVTITSTISQAGGNAALIKTGTFALTLGASNTYSGGTTVSAGTLNVYGDASTGTGNPTTAVITLASNTTLGFLGATTYTRRIVLSGDASLDMAVTATQSGLIGQTGTRNLTKTGTGTLTLSGINTYTGTTTVSAGTLNVSQDRNSGNGVVGTIPLILDSNSTLGFLGATTYSRIITLTGDASLDTGVTATQLGVISGAHNLTKTGTGTLTLSGINTYGGTTTIAAGTLNVSQDSNSGTDTTIHMSSGTTLGLTAATTYAKNISITGTGSINTSAAAQVSGIISGGSLTKEGASSLTLTTANTYTGTTTVNNGTLALGNSTGFIPSNPLVVDTAGTFDISNGIGTITVKTIDDGTNGGGTVALGSKNIIIDCAGTNSFSGSITGTGSLTKNGVGTQIFTGSNSYLGGTTVNAGTLQGNTAGVQGNILNDAAVVFDQTGVGTYSGVMSGTGTLTKTGSGDLIMADGVINTFSGTTYINAGRMYVMGTLPGPFIVNQGGELNGRGYVGTVTNHGSVAPGAGVGTIHVVGDYTQAADGTLNIEIDNLTSDYVYVTGVAHLDGAVDVCGVYLKDTVYTILTANGGVSGVFSSATINPATPGFHVNYSTNNVVLVVDHNAIRPGDPDNTLMGNPLLVQDYFKYDLTIAPYSDLYTVLTTLCCEIDYDTYVQALNELHPAVFSTVPELVYNNQYDVMQTFSRRLRTAYGSNVIWHDKNRCSSPWHTGLRYCDCLYPYVRNHVSLWIEPLAYFKKKATIGYDRGYHAQSAGFVMGADYRCGDHVLVGLGTGYTYDRSHWYYPDAAAHRSPDTVIHSVYGGGYGEAYSKHWYLNASVLGDYNHYHLRRRMNFGSINRTAESMHHGSTVSMHVEGGLHYLVTRHNIFVEPMAWCDYYRIHEHGFTEHGANSLNMVVDKKESRMIQSCIGVRAFKECLYRRCIYEPKVTVGWLYDVPLSSRLYSAHYVNQTPVLTTVGTDLHHSMALVAGDLLLRDTRNRSYTTTMHYEAHLRPHYHSQHIALSLEKRF